MVSNAFGVPTDSAKIAVGSCWDTAIQRSLYPPTDDYQIALDAVELCDARQMTPAFEAERFEEVSLGDGE